jgi:hypothetical protein
MKIYTEEQVEQMLMKARFHNLDESIDDIMKKTTPIELPSRENIQAENPYRFGGDSYNPHNLQIWDNAIIWLIDKLKGGNK